MKFNRKDVSKWQGTINWKKVKDSGINLFIIREECSNYNKIIKCP